ncbi:MAG: hypothetical protein OXG51_07710 [Gammaproteobacteria bacterium]|nr:hypothetical protein [Gammaproteobacteria bacterium]MCY3794247.1 hypothetical protein [Gammaproteobacteria bacterium]
MRGGQVVIIRQRYPVLTSDELVAGIERHEGNLTVMLLPMAGGAAPELTWESLELVPNKVIPALKQRGLAI